MYSKLLNVSYSGIFWRLVHSGLLVVPLPKPNFISICSIIYIVCWVIQVLCMYKYLLINVAILGKWCLAMLVWDTLGKLCPFVLLLLQGMTTPLIEAAKGGHTDTVKELLSLGGTVDLTDWVSAGKCVPLSCCLKSLCVEPVSITDWKWSLWGMCWTECFLYKLLYGVFFSLSSLNFTHTSKSQCRKKGNFL